nr:MAG TPA: hypothetical protein [Bacteriophage sp.]
MSSNLGLGQFVWRRTALFYKERKNEKFRFF